MIFSISGVTHYLNNIKEWCCERIIRRFGSFRAKQNFFKNLKFFDFFCISRSQISWKMTNFFFERYRPEICRGLHKWCCERILRCFRLFRAKKIFPRLPIFCRRFGAFRAKKNFFEGSQFFAFFCISIAWLFFAYQKKFFLRIGNFFTFFAYPGSQISWRMANYFFEKYRPEICRGLHKWCCERILRCFRSFRAKKNFFKNWKFFDFFCISGVTDFLKNDQLLFWEIRAWNFSWTAQMVLRKNFKAF